MILKGSQRGGALKLAVHLLRLDENDHVEVHELRGFSAAGPHAIALYVRATRGGVERAWGFLLDPEGEHRVLRMWMADVPTPPAGGAAAAPR